MSLLFTDGFDYYSIGDMYRKWQILAAGLGTSTISSAYSRNPSGQGLRTQRDGFYARTTVTGNDASYTLTAGLALRWESIPESLNRFSMIFGDSVNDAQCGLIIFPYTNQFHFVRGQQTSYSDVSIQAPFYFPYAWNYIELSIHKHVSTGWGQVNINGKLACRVDNVNFQNAGTNPLNFFEFGTYWSAPVVYVDDVYLTNNSGEVNTSFLGPIQIISLYPNNSGDSTQWTPSGNVNNYQNVNERSLITTTGFNYTTGLDVKDLYHFDDLALPLSTVKAISLNMMLNQSGTSPITAKHVLQVNNTGYSGLAVTLAPGNIVNYQRNWETNPNTLSPWTVDDVNNIQAGIITSS